MRFAEAMNELNKIEMTVAIEEPPMQIKHAYPFMPPMSKALEYPCFTHIPVSFVNAPHDASWRTRTYEVRTQLFVGRVESGSDVLSEAAMALGEAYLAALSAHLKLGLSELHLKLNAETGTDHLAVLEWAGQGYVGLNFLLSLSVSEPAYHGP